MSAFSQANQRGMSSSELLGRKTKRMTLEVPQELHAELKQVAAIEDRYIRDIVVEATIAWLKEKGYHK